MQSMGGIININIIVWHNSVQQGISTINEN
jgi:hypothetical protein